MQNKIRMAQEQKVPYMLVLGDREAEGRTATVRRRAAGKDVAQETVGWDDLAERLAEEAAGRKPDVAERRPEKAGAA
jgi:threonyl-tRNA synthetase